MFLLFMPYFNSYYICLDHKVSLPLVRWGERVNLGAREREGV